jgi:transitional endoplasmic reticulum ATPase
MDDLFREFEELFEQGVEGLLDIVRVIEGRVEPESEQAEDWETSRSESRSAAQSDSPSEHRTVQSRSAHSSVTKLFYF